MGKKKPAKKVTHTITLTFTKEEARQVVDTVAIKKITGSFYPQDNICDRVLDSIASTFYHGLFKKDEKATKGK